MRQPVRGSVSGAHLDSVHEGLRAYLQYVYAYMGMGLGLTGIVAYIVSSTPALYVPLLQSPLAFLFIFAPIGIAFYFGMSLHKMQLKTAQTLFWVYAALMGVSLASVFLIYTGESVTRIFLITSCMFGGMSLYGYTTKKDLSSWGSFLFMGLLGVIVASLVNFFMHSSALQFALSMMTVIIFTGLTAYDTQRIKNTYDEGLPSDVQAKTAIFGALQLYLDFINMFLAMLRLLGDRR